MAFFATAGGGTEIFVAKELANKGIDSKATVTQGKVFFKCEESSFKDLFQLKTVERVFVQIDHFKTSELVSTDLRHFTNSLCARIVSKPKLENILSLFRQVKLQEVATPDKYAVVKKVRKGGNKWLEQWKAKKDKRKRNQDNNDPLSNDRKRNKETDTRTSDDNGDDNKTEITDKGVDANIRLEGEGKESLPDESNTTQHEESSVSDDEDPRIKGDCTSVAMVTTDDGTEMGKDEVSKELKSDAKKESESEEDMSQQLDEPQKKKMKLSKDHDSVTFRINCKVAGSWKKLNKGRNKHPNTIRNPFSGCLGKAVTRLLNWKICLWNAELDICVFVNDEVVSAGIPISKVPISVRSFSHFPGLRYPLAWILGSLADIKDDDVVFDPMCGKGTILIEAATQITTARYIGMDADSGQLELAVQNLNASRTESTIHLFKGNVIYLPLKDNSVDKIVCDAPFGKQYSTKSSLDKFYPLFLKQMYRILKPHGTAVIMTGSSLKTIFLNCIRSSHTDEAISNVGEENVESQIEDTEGASSSRQTDQISEDEKIDFVKSAEYFMKLGRSEAYVFVLKSQKQF